MAQPWAVPRRSKCNAPGLGAVGLGPPSRSERVTHALLRWGRGAALLRAASPPGAQAAAPCNLLLDLHVIACCRDQS